MHECESLLWTQQPNAINRLSVARAQEHARILAYTENLKRIPLKRFFFRVCNLLSGLGQRSNLGFSSFSGTSFMYVRDHALASFFSIKRVLPSPSSVLFTCRFRFPFPCFLNFLNLVLVSSRTLIVNVWPPIPLCQFFSSLRLRFFSHFFSSSVEV